MMSENRNIKGNRISERLPVHSPDDSLWNNIASGLDNIDAQLIYQERLQDLPVHHPDDATWFYILRRIQIAKIARIGGYSALAVAASILLLISIIRLPETQLTPSAGIPTLSNERANKPIAQNKLSTGHTVSSVGEAKVRLANSSSKMNSDLLSGHSGISGQPGNLISLNNSADDATVASHDRQDIRLLLARINFVTPDVIKSIKPRRTSAKLPMSPVLANQPAVKYYTPDPYNPSKKKSSSFDLAANYRPESLENGTGTSLFNNFGLMASYGNEKTRVQSSLGMTYNSEHRTFDVAYTHLIAVTVPNPSVPSTDSTYIIPVKVNSNNLDGTEKHQYLTYDMGIGRKLFSLGKMTTWVNTGAGFAVKLDKASIKNHAVNTIKNQQNTVVNSIDIEIPEYNNVNINLMAGFDFDYMVMNRLTISFAPVSRIYLKPVLEMNGSATDSFSLGFRSGIKYKF